MIKITKTLETMVYAAGGLLATNCLGSTLNQPDDLALRLENLFGCGQKMIGYGLIAGVTLGVSWVAYELACLAKKEKETAKTGTAITIAKETTPTNRIEETAETITAIQVAPYLFGPERAYLERTGTMGEFTIAVTKNYRMALQDKITKNEKKAIRTNRDPFLKSLYFASQLEAMRKARSQEFQEIQAQIGELRTQRKQFTDHSAVEQAVKEEFARRMRKLVNTYGKDMENSCGTTEKEDWSCWPRGPDRYNGRWINSNDLIKRYVGHGVMRTSLEEHEEWKASSSSRKIWPSYSHATSSETNYIDLLTGDRFLHIQDVPFEEIGSQTIGTNLVIEWTMCDLNPEWPIETYPARRIKYDLNRREIVAYEQRSRDSTKFVPVRDSRVENNSVFYFGR
jgi:hypothetical protein